MQIVMCFFVFVLLKFSLRKMEVKMIQTETTQLQEGIGGRVSLILQEYPSFELL